MKNFIFSICALFFLLSCSTKKEGQMRYQTTSESMLPNIAPGDILTFDTIEAKHHLDYGDIIRCIFYINGEKDYDIFRIIGLPGDSISVYSNTPIINGIKCNNIYIENIEFNIFKFEVFEELLPNKKKIKICKETIGKGLEIERDHFPATKIPDGCYFVLGDSRSLCIDSRFIGFIPQSNIVGKLTAIEKYGQPFQ